MALEEWDTCYDDLHNVHRPYIRYIRATSREQKVLTSISEAFVHLDMSTAGKDLRRFNYVNKVNCRRVTSVKIENTKKILNLIVNWQA
jgi:hypothetical protein